MLTQNKGVLLTVVLPVLNGEKYIEECLESVIEQEVHCIEILVIDAGSTDKTLNIVNDYANIDKRIRVIHSTKKSYGAQVNLGIDSAQGRYLSILEADDLLPLSAYSIMLHTIQETGVDIVKGNYYKFISDTDGRKIASPDDLFENTPDIYGQIINARIRTDILRRDRYLWRAIYDLKFLKKNNIRLNESPGAAFQDLGFLMQTLILAKRIIYLKDCVYYYRKDNALSSVYSPNAFKYVADEYELIDAFMSSIPVDERSIYLPVVYLTLMDMIRTRCLLRGLDKKVNDIDPEILHRLQILLERGKNNKLLGKDARFQKDLFEVNLFIKSPYEYMAYAKNEILAEKEDVNNFFRTMKDYDRVVVCGFGKTGSTLKMLLAKRNVNIEIIWTDGNAEVVAQNDELNDTEIIAKKYGNKSLYIICAVKHRYEIREKLHKNYGVEYRNILFYTLGTSPNLLLM